MMTAPAAPLRPAPSDSLPPIGGRLFTFYRIAWWTLFALAFAAVGLALFDPDVHPLILTLRLVKSLVLMSVSAILFRRRKEDPVAAMLGLSFLLWTISSSVDFAGSDGAIWPLLLDRCRFLLFAFALLLFPDGHWQPRWTRFVGAVILLVFAVGLAEAAGLLATAFYLPLAIGCVVLAIAALLVRYRLLSSDIARQQLKWVALGLVIGIGLILSARAGAAITAGSAMPMAARILLEGLFQAGIVVLALGFLTSLLRFRLYDAEAAISRSAAYAALTLSLVATFAASEAIIQGLGQRYFGPSFGELSGGIAAACAAMLLTPLHGKLSNWAEQYFQRDLAGLRTDLPGLLAALSGGGSLARFSSSVLPHIEEAMHASRSGLLVDGRLVAIRGVSKDQTARWIRTWSEPAATELFDTSEDDLFPLRMALRCPLGRIRAWLLLGPRPDGSLHGQDEIEALQAIAANFERALLAVADRQAAQTGERRLRRNFVTALRTIEKRVSSIEHGGNCSEHRKH